MSIGKKGVVADGLHRCTRRKLSAMVGKMRHTELSKKEKRWHATIYELAARTTEVWLGGRIDRFSKRQATLQEAFECAREETAMKHYNLAEGLGVITLRELLRIEAPGKLLICNFILDCFPKKHSKLRPILKQEMEPILRPRGARGRFVSPKVLVSQSLGVNGHSCQVAVIARSNGYLATINGKMTWVQVSPHLAGVGAK